jgi:hypothetical protein
VVFRRFSEESHRRARPNGRSANRIAQPPIRRKNPRAESEMDGGPVTGRPPPPEGLGVALMPPEFDGTGLPWMPPPPLGEGLAEAVGLPPG